MWSDHGPEKTAVRPDGTVTSGVRPPASGEHCSVTCSCRSGGVDDGAHEV